MSSDNFFEWTDPQSTDAIFPRQIKRYATSLLFPDTCTSENTEKEYLSNGCASAFIAKATQKKCRVRDLCARTRKALHRLGQGFFQGPKRSLYVDVRSETGSVKAQFGFHEIRYPNPFIPNGTTQIKRCFVFVCRKNVREASSPSSKLAQIARGILCLPTNPKHHKDRSPLYGEDICTFFYDEDFTPGSGQKREIDAFVRETADGAAQRPPLVTFVGVLDHPEEDMLAFQSMMALVDSNVDEKCILLRTDTMCAENISSKLAQINTMQLSSLQSVILLDCKHEEVFTDSHFLRFPHHFHPFYDFDVDVDMRQMRASIVENILKDEGVNAASSTSEGDKRAGGVNDSNIYESMDHIHPTKDTTDKDSEKKITTSSNEDFHTIYTIEECNEPEHINKKPYTRNVIGPTCAESQQRHHLVAVHTDHTDIYRQLCNFFCTLYDTGCLLDDETTDIHLVWVQEERVSFSLLTSGLAFVSVTSFFFPERLHIGDTLRYIYQAHAQTHHVHLATTIDSSFTTGIQRRLSEAEEEVVISSTIIQAAPELCQLNTLPKQLHFYRDTIWNCVRSNTTMVDDRRWLQKNEASCLNKRKHKHTRQAKSASRRGTRSTKQSSMQGAQASTERTDDCSMDTDFYYSGV